MKRRLCAVVGVALLVVPVAAHAQVDIALTVFKATVIGPAVKFDITMCTTSVGSAPITFDLHFWADRSPAPTCTTPPDIALPVTLPANKCMSFSETVSGALPGTYEPWLKVDGKCKVPETNEGNNLVKAIATIFGLDYSVPELSSEVTDKEVSVRINLCVKGKSRTFNEIGIWLNSPTRPTCTTPPDAVAALSMPTDSCITETIKGGVINGNYKLWVGWNPRCTDPDSNSANDFNSTTFSVPGCDKAYVGKICSPRADLRSADCGSNTSMRCVTRTNDPTVAKPGVCTCGCKQDNPATPLADEDTCPKPANKCVSLRVTTAGLVSTVIGIPKKYCFKTCTPQLGRNECDTGSACNPLSTEISNQVQPICLLSSCRTNADCPVYTSKLCKLGDTTCLPSERCLSRTSSVKGGPGQCAKTGKCDIPSGQCTTRTTDFVSGARPGDPCTGDEKCGANSYCVLKVNKTVPPKKPGGVPCVSSVECCGVCQSGKCSAAPCWDVARNGTCIMRGCNFASTLTDRKCPTGTTCNRVFLSGSCLRRCVLGDAKTCRGNAADRASDNDCRDWTPFTILDESGKAQKVADSPTCEWGPAVPCSYFRATKTLSCANLGGAGNKTNMACRNPATGVVLTDPKSSLGYCLDDTLSGGR